jgi:hypothetical protein
LAEHWKTKLSGCALRWNPIYKRWEVAVSSNLFEFCTIDLIYNFLLKKGMIHSGTLLQKQKIKSKLGRGKKNC